jgi:hypothetical protein
MKFLVAVVLATVLSVSVWSSHAQELFGRFKGEIVASWDAGGRNMKLQSPFGYVDPSGLEWDVPAGYETDGASVPTIFWSPYPPFTGKYRAAAVIHDYYCYARPRPWQLTHQVFYFAMRAAGVAERQAKVMYGAVYFFGPRWGIGAANRGPGAETAPSVEQQAQVMQDLEKWIAKDNPDLGEIGRQLESGAVPKI